MPLSYIINFGASSAFLQDYPNPHNISKITLNMPCLLQNLNRSLTQSQGGSVPDGGRCSWRQA